MKAVVYSFTRRGAMLSINIGEALQKFDFEVRCLTMPKFAEEKIFLEAMDDQNQTFAVLHQYLYLALLHVW